MTIIWRSFSPTPAATASRPAALLTMLIGRLLPMKDQTHHTHRIVPPGEAMARLNAAYVQRQPDASRLITAIYGVLNVRSGQVHHGVSGDTHRGDRRPARLPAHG